MDFKKGLVSVIIATHNRANLVSRAIESILNQTYICIEIIVVNDKSEDSTAEILKGYKNKDLRITVVETIKNVGGAAARNIGIKMAMGEYLAFLDDDDAWYPNKIWEQKKILDECTKYAIVSANYDIECSKETSYRKKSLCVSVNEALYKNVIGSFSFCMTKKEYVVGLEIDESLKAAQDWDLWIKIMLKTQKKAYLMKQKLVLYNSDPKRERLTTSVDNANKSHFIFIQKYSHIMSGMQLSYNYAKYYTVRSQIDLSPEYYLKGIMYSVMSIWKIRYTEWYSILFPVFLLGNDKKNKIKKIIKRLSSGG